MFCLFRVAFLFFFLAFFYLLSHFENIFGISKICQDMSRCVKICQEMSRYVKRCQEGMTRYVRICQDMSRYVKTFQDMTSLKQIRVGI